MGAALSKIMAYGVAAGASSDIGELAIGKAKIRERTMSLAAIEAFIAECRAALAGEEPLQRIAALMRPLIQDPVALSRAVISTGERIAPNTVLLHRSPELTVLDIRQRGGHRGFPHNHLMWVVAGVYLGEEHNTFYRRQGDSIVAEGETIRLKAPAIAVLPADAWHGTHNPLEEDYATLQVCGGDFLAATPQRLAWDESCKRIFPFSEALTQLRSRSE